MQTTRTIPVRCSSRLLFGGLAALIANSAVRAADAAPDAAVGARRYPPVMPEARAEVYKSVDATKLNLYIFDPKNHSATNRSPAIVFFFGGGWTSGSPQQFEKQCQYFASRGMVAITADYRVASRHQVKPAQCVEDARSAIRWVRQNAAKLGVDPNRIVAAGGSAGGHLAGLIAVAPDAACAGEDSSISSIPNAAILFNPALVLAPLDGQDFGKAGARLNSLRLGTEPEKISPAHQVRAGAPPILIFHGEADTTVPFPTSKEFAQKMKAAGNRCELVGFPDQAHGFFNYRPGNNRYFLETLTQADQFLASLGYLSGPSQVEAFFKKP